MSSDIYIHRRDIPTDCLWDVCAHEYDTTPPYWHGEDDTEPEKWDRGIVFNCNYVTFCMLADHTTPSDDFHHWNDLNEMTARRLSGLLRRALQKIDRLTYTQLKAEYGDHALPAKQKLRDMREFALSHPLYRVHVEE